MVEHNFLVVLLVFGKLQPSLAYPLFKMVLFKVGV